MQVAMRTWGFGVILKRGDQGQPIDVIPLGEFEAPTEEEAISITKGLERRLPGLDLAYCELPPKPTS